VEPHREQGKAELQREQRKEAVASGKEVVAAGKEVVSVYRLSLFSI
jgi:hypothetical protein